MAIFKLQSVLPYRWRVFVKKIYVGKWRGAGSKLTCPICRARCSSFLPLQQDYYDAAKEYEYIYSFDEIETLNQNEYQCPVCMANDRDRLYCLYLRKAGILKAGLHFLEFAPGEAFEHMVRSHIGVDYRTADLFKNAVDDTGVDICDMHQYPDASFDFFICSHVLEHVTRPDDAIRELFRVLAPGGSGIIMVPIVLGLAVTQEDKQITSSAARWKYYGQGDHLRQFAKQDFMRRLRDGGFIVEQLDKDFFGEAEFRAAGISMKSVLYLVRK